MEVAVSNAPYASLIRSLLSLLLNGSLYCCLYCLLASSWEMCVLPSVLGVAQVPPLAAALLILVSPSFVYLL